MASDFIQETKTLYEICDDQKDLMPVFKDGLFTEFQVQEFYDIFASAAASEGRPTYIDVVDYEYPAATT